MTKQISIFVFLSTIVLSHAADSFAAPWGLPRDLTDGNAKIEFEVEAPWSVLDGTAEQVSGKVSLADAKDPGSLRADVSVQDIVYDAGLSVAGRLVEAWLRLNPPTPAKFVIGKSTLNCAPETVSAQKPCKGSVDGKLTIWKKSYNVDVPVQMKRASKGFLLEGMKRIKWGDYGFGDPSSTLSNLKPVIVLNFSIELPSGK